ncbi:MAG: DUF3662 domain-containing protein [Peptococcaceae bacterium]|jgi:hypothetical protein|nr:DUF3662 domain-containing protein [Peptococcaceae bacterium]
MKLLAKAESVAEFIVTYFFRQSSGTIQPVKVARELSKVMLKNKQVSIAHVYVPNLYRVYLHQNDYSILESFGETFRTELAKHLYDEGKKQGFTFLTPPLVEIKVGKDICPGGIDIKTEFKYSLVVPWHLEEENNSDETEDIEKTTLLVDAVKKVSSLEPDLSRKSRFYLEIIKGNGAGKVCYLDQKEVIIGRNQDCDIIIDDMEISRQHLRLVYENRRWFVQDLGSTNGTYVNKLRVDRYMVNPGDRIKAGQTHFRFNIDK